MLHDIWYFGAMLGQAGPNWFLTDSATFVHDWLLDDGLLGYQKVDQSVAFGSL